MSFKTLPQRRGDCLQYSIIVCDCMLGKLARMLRILGFNVVYFNSIKDKELIEKSKKLNAILLTRDKELAKKYNPSVYVPYQNVNEQLVYIIDRFKKFEIISQESYLEICPMCGYPIILVEKEAIKSEVYEGTYCSYEEFYYCPNCGKIYWKGPQYQELIKRVNQLSLKLFNNLS